MVVEREPNALRHARPFMYRHLDALADALDAPPLAMKERFASIEMLNYSPTFDQAADVVRTYFAELRAIRKMSASQAEAFVSAHNLTWQQIDTIRGEYDGPMIHLTERHAVQDFGRNRAVVHDVEQLDRDVQLGDGMLRIRYRNGRAAVTPAQKPAGTEHM